jgi:hypothetical protein
MRPMTINTSIIPKFMPALKMPAMASQPVKRVSIGSKSTVKKNDFFIVVIFD